MYCSYDEGDESSYDELSAEQQREVMKEFASGTSGPMSRPTALLGIVWSCCVPAALGRLDTLLGGMLLT